MFLGAAAGIEQGDGEDLRNGCLVLRILGSSHGSREVIGALGRVEELRGGAELQEHVCSFCLRRRLVEAAFKIGHSAVGRSAGKCLICRAVSASPSYTAARTSDVLAGLAWVLRERRVGPARGRARVAATGSAAATLPGPQICRLSTEPDTPRHDPDEHYSS